MELYYQWKEGRFVTDEYFSMEEELMQDEIRGGEKIRRIGLENLRKE